MQEESRPSSPARAAAGESGAGRLDRHLVVVEAGGEWQRWAHTVGKFDHGDVPAEVRRADVGIGVEVPKFDLDLLVGDRADPVGNVRTAAAPPRHDAEVSTVIDPSDR